MRVSMDRPPLRLAGKLDLLSRPRALELVQGTGWEVVSINDPTPAIQHYIVARPV